VLAIALSDHIIHTAWHSSLENKHFFSTPVNNKLTADFAPLKIHEDTGGVPWFRQGAFS